MKACPNCKTEFQTEHSFCPACGGDLRTSHKSPDSLIKASASEKPLEKDSKEFQNPLPKFWRKAITPFILAILFMSFSIFLWSYAFQNWKFNQEMFINRLINHLFWLILFPFLLSVFFNKSKRARIYSGTVTIVIIIGGLALWFGNMQFQANYAPFNVRYRLKNQCTSEVLLQLEEVRTYQSQFESSISRTNKVTNLIQDMYLEYGKTTINRYFDAEIINNTKEEFGNDYDKMITSIYKKLTRNELGSEKLKKIKNQYDLNTPIRKQLDLEKYCHCLLEKVNDNDMVSIAKEEKYFWPLIKESYPDLPQQCIIAVEDN